MSLEPKSASAAPAEPPVDAAERRALPRFDGQQIAAYVRRKGSFSRQTVEVLDFNRHGAAIHLHAPLPREQVIYLTLKLGATQLERIIGVVHNCLNLKSGYRCGVRFRTQSNLQFDRAAIEDELVALERRLEGGA